MVLFDYEETHRRTNQTVTNVEYLSWDATLRVFTSRFGTIKQFLTAGYSYLYDRASRIKFHQPDTAL